MESYMNSVDDVLIDGLTYNLEPGASYVKQRRSVTFFHKGPISTQVNQVPS